MSKFTGLFVFAMGAASGAMAAYLITKNKYEQLIQEEIESVKKSFEKAKRQREESVKRREETKADQKEYAEKASGYARYSGRSKEDMKKEMEKNMADMPYVISPDEFGDFPDYAQISLTYYADGVLADDMDEIVDDVAETVGLSSLEHFGEYEEDAVFVRNDGRRADYEILRDERTYEAVVGRTVYGSRVEDE